MGRSGSRPVFRLDFNCDGAATFYYGDELVNNQELQADLGGEIGACCDLVNHKNVLNARIPRAFLVETAHKIEQIASEMD